MRLKYLLFSFLLILIFISSFTLISAQDGANCCDLEPSDCESAYPNETESCSDYWGYDHTGKEVVCTKSEMQGPYGEIMQGCKAGSTPCYFDCDHDGHKREEDCDDYDEDVYPGAPEMCYAGLDEDCDGHCVYIDQVMFNEKISILKQSGKFTVVNEEVAEILKQEAQKSCKSDRECVVNVPNRWGAIGFTVMSLSLQS